MLTKQKGFTLIEAMISIAISLFLMLGIIGFFMSSSQASLTNMKSVRLNSGVRSSVDFVTNDLLRASYWAGSTDAVLTGAYNPFSKMAVYTLASERDCIVFSYDANKNGTVEADEHRGFRKNGVFIESKTSGGNEDTCTDGTWVVMTPKSVELQTLQFTLLETWCKIEDGVCGAANPAAAANTYVINRAVGILVAGNYKGDTNSHQEANDLINVRNAILN